MKGCGLMGEYTIAQICLNGHIITEDISDPELLENYCSLCGESTITKCNKCNAPIRGDYYVGGRIAISNCTVPKYCYHCGIPYPWTQTAIDSATALVEEMETFESTEKETLKSLIPNIIFESTKTELSAIHIANFLQKATASFQEVFKHTLYGLTVEAAKRIIWPI